MPKTPGDAVSVDFPIVGIGASAGGLEAITELLRFLPRNTGMAFVLVQHLAPKHGSLLSEILSGGTEMTVSEARDRTGVEPNHVYVIPPNANLELRRGLLELNPRAAGTQHMPIDIFFRSLAQEQGGRAIGVILSGTASDGALGMKAIKAEGGITFAQDPASAKYDGMPRAAIAAGAADFVLPPEQIATEISKIGRHPYVALPATAHEEVSAAQDRLDQIFRLLKETTGADFTFYKHATIKRRINRRMALLKLERLAEYIQHLYKDPAEIDALYQDILIHVTGFFRDPAPFEALTERIFPKILQNRSGDAPVRIWVPGCSTGEEAYTVAIALLEALGERAASVPVQLFATDISAAAIENGRNGVYPETIAADLSPERLRRHFRKVEGGYQVSKSIRDMCIFAKQDVTKDPPFSNLDLISCRNVMIYLGPILQKRVMTVFHYALKPSGYLLVGTSETVGSFVDFFGPADKKNRIFFKKATLVRAPLDFSSEYATTRAEASRPDPLPRPRSGLLAEVDRQILDALEPAAIVVDSDLQIVQFRGETGRYLEPMQGEASLNLLRMAKQGLGLELRRAIQSAGKKNRRVGVVGVAFKHGGEIGKVSLDVIPLDSQTGRDRRFLILFQEPRPVQKTATPKRGQRTKDDKLLQKLESELQATRDYLQSIIQDMDATNEELQSANEEVLSANEELQSTNEELETAKEELQSTNEELNTVNEELQNRNEELSRLNSDLTNLLASVQIPIIMTGSDLRIRRFTPMAARVFNLIPTDLGRPIGDIKSNLNLQNLTQVLVETMDTVSVREMEVQDAEGRWYSLKTRPYKTLDNKIDGAVLSLMDIDRLRRRVDAHLDVELLEMVRHPVALLDQDLKLKHANRSFYETFRLSREKAQNRVFFELSDGLWESPAWRTLLEELLPKQGRIKDYEIEQDTENGQRKKLLVSAAANLEAGRPEFVLLGIEEVERPAALAADRDSA